MLKEDTIYIASGLERSGTSMLMQILDGGNVPVLYDSKRRPDEHNPRGYYELAGGKIINLLQENPNYVDNFRGKGFVKITAYGLLFLPQRKYKIIFIERNMNEVLDSMEKMKKKEDFEREEIKKSLTKLLRHVKRLILKREDMDVLQVSYNKILENPQREIKKIGDFIGNEFNLDQAVSKVDKKLYRNRANKK